MSEQIKELTKDLQYYTSENKTLEEQNIGFRVKILGLKAKNIDLREQLLKLKKQLLELKAQFNPHEETFRRKFHNCYIKNNQLKTQIDELKQAGRKVIEIARFVDEFQILDLEPLFKEDE